MRVTDTWAWPDWTPTQLECDGAGHAEGEGGCEPGTPGLYLVEILHDFSASAGQCRITTPRRVIFCQGRAIRVRGNRGTTVTCPKCQTRIPYDDAIRVLGHIDTVKVSTP